MMNPAWFDDLPASAADLSARVYASPKPDQQTLRMMMLLEATGRRFYEQLAAALGPGEAAERLLMSAGEEWGHAHRVAKAIQILFGEACEVPAEAANPFVEPKDFSQLSAEMLRGFAASERRGEALYLDWAQACPDPRAATLLRLNADEERRHAERLEAAAAALEA
jgi:rubrerythrin